MLPPKTGFAGRRAWIRELIDAYTSPPTGRAAPPNATEEVADALLTADAQHSPRGLPSAG